MRKILLVFSIFMFFVSCGEVKKAEREQGQEEDIDIELLEVDEELDTVISVKEKKGILDPTKGVLVVFKAEVDVLETKKIIESKGLRFEKEWISDKNSLKIGVIHVPANEKQEWLNKLIESGRFTDVKLYSEENLKKLIEDRKERNKK